MSYVDVGRDFYAPIADVVTIPFDDLVIRLSEAGFTCKVEPETENMIWITFDNLDSSLLASVTAGQFVFGTLHASLTEEGLPLWSVYMP